MKLEIILPVTSSYICSVIKLFVSFSFSSSRASSLSGDVDFEEFTKKMGRFKRALAKGDITSSNAEMQLKTALSLELLLRKLMTMR